jgi:hypothetical protein
MIIEAGGDLFVVKHGVNMCQVAVTQHTTACCSMQVIDITLAEQASTNITSLRMVQQKHCGPKYKLNNKLLQTKA